MVSKPCFPYGRYDFAVGLSSKPDTQHLVEIRIRLAFFRKSLPDDFRVSVRGEKPGMGDVEISVRFHYLIEIVLVETIGNQFNRRIGHGLEILLHQRRNRNYHSSIVQHLLLQSLMLFLGPAAQTQMLEVEHPGPRVPEISHPRKSCGGSQLPGNQVH